MEKKINIAELLKDCPSGMELDCTMFDGVTLSIVDVSSSYPIVIGWQEGKVNHSAKFTEYGCWNHNPNAKCVIFPKGKTTWEGFQRPFKDGDILSYQFSGFENRSIYIYMYHPRMNTTYYVAVSGNTDSKFMINDQEGHALNSYSDTVRFATEEEKQKLFDAIKANGYKWNADTKTLEKLIEPKFKVGNRVVKKNGIGVPVLITCVGNDHYYSNTENSVGYFSIQEQDDWELFEPKFQVGDRIKKKNGKDVHGAEQGVILSITDDTYDVAVTNNMGIFVPIADQDDWELVPNKFDITTLKPFDKVLVRDTKEHVWVADLFSHQVKRPLKGYAFACVGHYPNQCIPYEGNEHLLGTTYDCDNFYKTWE